MNRHSKNTSVAALSVQVLGKEREQKGTMKKFDDFIVTIQNNQALKKNVLCLKR